MRIIQLANSDQYMVNVICAWCGKVIGTKLSSLPRPTHALCKTCLKIHFPQFPHKEEESA